MHKLRLIIREIFKNEFNAEIGSEINLLEAVKTGHFIKRVDDRLESDDTTFVKEEGRIKQIIYDAIDFLAKVNFPGQDNIAIRLFKSPNYYKYYRQVNGKIERSQGNRIWVIVKGNDLETIVFGDIVYDPMKSGTSKMNIDFNLLKNSFFSLILLGADIQFSTIYEKLF